MILVILPLGKEAKDVWNWVFRVFMYACATTVGASLMALTLGLVGQGLHNLFPGIGYEWAVGFLGVASVVFALKELNIIKLWTPQHEWQVPKSWQKRSRVFGQTAYGLVLGAGIFTYIPFASFFTLLGLEVVAGAFDLRAAVLIGFVYGLVRGVMAVMGGISMLRDKYPLDLSNWLIGHLGWWHAINGLALLFVASFILSSFFI